MVAINREVQEAWLRGVTKPDRRPIADWVCDHVVLRGAYAIPGKVNLSISPYLYGPLACLNHKRVRQVNVLKPIQTAGTLIADLYLQWIFANSPGPVMWVLQSDEDATQHYTMRIKPTFEATEINAKMFSKCHKRRDLHQYPHMDALFVGANINSLHGKSIKYLVLDEPWLYKPGLLQEAKARVEASAYKESSKILMVSQGGIKGDDWWDEYDSGVKHKWHVRCKACDEAQELKFFDRMEVSDDHLGEVPRAGVVYDKTLDGDGNIDLDATAITARYKCRHCGHEHPDRPESWSHFSGSGHYPELDMESDMPEVVSFSWGLVDGYWGRNVRRFLGASEALRRGAKEPMRAFYQKRLPAFWDEGIVSGKIDLTVGAYAKREPWSDAKMTFMGVDYQAGAGNDKSHFWFVIRAFSGHGESRLIDEGRLEEVDDIVVKQRSLGIMPKCVSIDGGYERYQVARWCAKYGWTMLVGSDKESFVWEVKQPGVGKIKVERICSRPMQVDGHIGTALQGRHYAVCITWSNPAVKAILWELRHGKGVKWDVPMDVSEDYKDHIDNAVRKMMVNATTGKHVWVWSTPYKGAPDHMRDCECMILACAIMSGVLNFDVSSVTEGAASDNDNKETSNE